MTFSFNFTIVHSYIKIYVISLFGDQQKISFSVIYGQFVKTHPIIYLLHFSVYILF